MWEAEVGTKELEWMCEAGHGPAGAAAGMGSELMCGGILKWGKRLTLAWHRKSERFQNKWRRIRTFQQIPKINCYMNLLDCRMKLSYRKHKNLLWSNEISFNNKQISRAVAALQQKNVIEKVILKNNWKHKTSEE